MKSLWANQMCYQNILQSLNTDGNKLQKSVFRHFWVQQYMQKFDSHERNETITSFPTKPPSQAVHFYFLTNGFLSLFKIICAFGQ